MPKGLTELSAASALTRYVDFFKHWSTDERLYRLTHGDDIEDAPSELVPSVAEGLIPAPLDRVAKGRTDWETKGTHSSCKDTRSHAHYFSVVRCFATGISVRLSEPYRPLLHTMLDYFRRECAVFEEDGVMRERLETAERLEKFDEEMFIQVWFAFVAAFGLCTPPSLGRRKWRPTRQRSRLVM